MREVGNRIVHEYFPEAQSRIVDDIKKHYGPELISLNKRIEKLVSQLNKTG
ncbi:hypothetical protein JW835_14625 [bacterium]|nr:hypothetical protein [bacterium]